MDAGIVLAESGWLPDWILRRAIQNLVHQRLIAAQADFASGAQDAFIRSLASSPIALASDASREQHYETPTDFFQLVLGPRLKYSCCLYDTADTPLAQAEEAMLALTCARAQVENGMDILELGCGWGALTLWMAENYPECRITALSNSSTQREFIEMQCRRAGFNNVEIVTADIKDFDTSKQFDRVVSVEMFEHLRNYPEMLRRIANWLVPDGRLFIHIFCHKQYTYPFIADGRGNWMARNFFTGGLMPSSSLLSRFDKFMVVEDSWNINGMHYYRTCMDWLTRLDAHEREVRNLFSSLYGKRPARKSVQRWRMFFMACAELFRYSEGEEWQVGHYLLKKNSSRNPA